MGFWSSEMGIELYQEWRKWAPENYRGSAVVSKCVATCCDISKACWTQDQQQTGYTIEIVCPSNRQQETDIHWPQWSIGIGWKMVVASRFPIQNFEGTVSGSHASFGCCFKLETCTQWVAWKDHFLAPPRYPQIKTHGLSPCSFGDPEKLAIEYWRNGIRRNRVGRPGCTSPRLDTRSGPQMWAATFFFCTAWFEIYHETWQLILRENNVERPFWIVDP